MNEDQPWKVIAGDALKVLTSLPTESVDAVVTDPPYSSGGMVRGDRMASTRAKYQSTDVQTEHPSFSGDNRDQRSFGYWCAMWLAECRRVTKPGGMLCVFTDWRQLPTTTDAVQAGGWVWRGIVPWDKVQARPVPGRFRAQAEYMVWATNGPRDMTPTDEAVYGGGVFRVTTTPTDDREHATQKPVELMRQVIEVVTKKGETVLDPFAGSGSTGVACVMDGRKFIGIEMMDHFVEVASNRIKNAEIPLFI